MLRLKPLHLSIPTEYGRPSPNDGKIAGRWYKASFCNVYVEHISIIRLKVNPRDISPKGLSRDRKRIFYKTAIGYASHENNIEYLKKLFKNKEDK